MIHHTFIDYFIREELQLDVVQLEKYALQLEREHFDDGLTISNYGGWHSRTNIQHDPKFLELKSAIETTIDAHAPQLGYAENFLVDNMWINVNRETHFNSSHIHPLSYFSGAFYIKTPENCGDLVFDNCKLKTALSYGLRRTSSNNYNSSRWFLTPYSNTLIIFPSSASHYVEPNRSKEPRISISFNLIKKEI